MKESYNDNYISYITEWITIKDQETSSINHRRLIEKTLLDILKPEKVGTNTFPGGLQILINENIKVDQKGVNDLYEQYNLSPNYPEPFPFTLEWKVDKKKLNIIKTKYPEYYKKYIQDLLTISHNKPSFRIKSNRSS